MAGIGFELYRILHKGTIGSILKVFILGTIIVAGPWILSVISIYLIQTYAATAISEHPALFTVSIVYIYAFSLILFGGFHYVFSRYIADMLYIEDHKSIPSALLTIVIFISFLAAGFAYVFTRLNDFSFLRYSSLYAFSLVFLFVSVNLIWIMLVYVALLKEYYKIFVAYLLGSIGSITGVLYLGDLYGVAGALLGYASGQFLIVLLLIIVSNKSYKMELRLNIQVFVYFKDFRYLFFIGFFFNSAIWIDKIMYWFTNGINIKGTLYYYFIDYDIPVFLAFITMIPGLVYFLVITEPLFHTAYFRFVKNILRDPLTDITANKQAMMKNLKIGFIRLIAFQGIWTCGLIINIHSVKRFMGYQTVNPAILSILFAAAFFHMLLLTLQIYLMYLEFRKEALLGTIIYLALNALLCVTFINYTDFLPGISYLAAAVIATIYCIYPVIKKVPMIDYIIFNR